MKKVFHLFAVAMCGVLMLTVVSCQEKNNPEEENGNISSQVQAVDLGLPSGIKWANMNVGATTPEGYGDYFAWGETSTKTTYDWSTYFDSDDGSTFQKYKLGGKTTLDLADDAAAANWKGAWRMPTKAEIQELKDKCTWTWTRKNGINGYEVKGPNDNTIFLPASGYRYGTSLISSVGSYGDYWSSSLSEDNSSGAYGLGFDSGGVYWGSGNRYFGLSVRPVCQ